MSNARIMPLSLNNLMKHLRESHQLADLRGSDNKVRLRNMGYFHGYKGYRFVRQGSNQLPLSSFEELRSVYDFDMNIKAALYPRIMFLETALKGIVLARALENCEDASLSYFMSHGLSDCRDENGDVLAGEMRRKLRLKTTLQRYVSSRYASPHFKHYINRYDDVPLWSVVESMTLHDLGELVHMLPQDARGLVVQDITGSMPSEPNLDLAHDVIEAMRPMRNAIAHNAVVFDARFSPTVRQGGGDLRNVVSFMEDTLGASNMFDMRSIVDYVVLTTILVRHISQRKTDAGRLLREVRSCLDKLLNETGVSLYMKIVGSGAAGKLERAGNWLNEQ